MNIKILLDKTNNFILNRLTELVGILFLIISVLLFISLVTYSPEDPNFIYPNNSDIRNFLGFRGSFVSDIFYQSIGLISLLIPFSIFFTGSTPGFITINFLLITPKSIARFIVYCELAIT